MNQMIVNSSIEYYSTQFFQTVTWHNEIVLLEDEEIFSSGI